MSTIKILNAFLLAVAGAATLPVYGQQAIDTAELSENKVVVNDVSKAEVAGKTFLAGTIINASVQKLCSTVLDYSNYPSFMPNTEKTDIVFASDDYSLVDMHLKLPLGKTKKYRLKLEPKTSPQTCQLSWKLVPWAGLTPDETIADTTGYWQFSPDPANKNRTIVKYLVYADPGHVPFGLGWIVDLMSKDSLPKTLEALRTRVALR